MRISSAIKRLLIIALTSSLAHAASLDKARSFLDNGFRDAARKELIEVAYAPNSSSNDKAESLYLLGKVNLQDGRLDLAKKNWRMLLEKYPLSPKAKLARENLSEDTQYPSSHTSTKDHGTAETDLHTIGSSSEKIDITKQLEFSLISRGSPPRYLLRYTASTTPELVTYWVKVAVLEGDCPTKTSEKKYPSVEENTKLTILTSPDAEQGVIRIDASWKVESVESPSQRRDVKTGRDWVRIKPNGELINSSNNESEISDFGFSTFPLEPVGVGARWKVPVVLRAGASNFVVMSTNTIEYIDSDSARLRSELYIDATMESEGRKVHFQGGGDGTIVWQAGRIAPPGSSNKGFIRITDGPSNQSDKPEILGCILTRSGTR